MRGPLAGTCISLVLRRKHFGGASGRMCTLPSDKANLPLIAAGVAFFRMCSRAIPEAGRRCVTLVGLLGDPDWVGEQNQSRLRGRRADAR